jgi:hypothetical protein
LRRALSEASVAGDYCKKVKRFGGEKFNPVERGRGDNWARWRRHDS